MVQSKNWSKQGFLLSSTIIFLEGIWSDALKEYGGTVSIGGKIINNLWFANDTDALAMEEQEIEFLLKSLDKACTRYKMEINDKQHQ